MTRIYTIFLFLCFCSSFLFAQSSQDARDRSVELELVDEGGDFYLKWTADANAPEYRVYQKELNDITWGDPIAILPGDATRFDDVELFPGTGKEFAVFKYEFDLIVKTVEVPAGADFVLEFADMFNIGLCCDFGFGYYRLSGCGQELAYGDDFGSSDITTFTVCDNGAATETLTLTIKQDMFPQSTSYLLREVATDSVYLTSGEPGTLLAQNPAYGYIYAGNRLPPVHNRGGIILLIEESIRLPISPEVDRLRLDLVRDGWKTYLETAAMTESVTDIRARIQTLYQENPEINTLFIIGHVPVPYSGEIAPDTHFENHEGAWAADVYYGELNGNWTDTLVSNTSAQFTYNHNIPGDGKFDQDSIPTAVELAVGRVDFFDMPAFADSEVELLQKYFQKNHLYRNAFYDIPRRALVDDNFGNTFAAPAASAWRNFSTMFGAENIAVIDYFSNLSTTSGYLWSYGCGSGSHISAEGIGSTQDFAFFELNTVFTMLFGSQFGDWDNTNNFLRAPLASGLTLTNCWAGSPPWTFHHMSLGAPIGTSVLATQNSRSNGGVYLDNGPQLVHIALMGDPSLRMHMAIAPASAFAQMEGDGVRINWNPAGGLNIEGYNIYRSTDQFGDYELINDTPINATTYLDTPPSNALYHYLVRTVVLEFSASGSYLNLSPGTPASTEFIVGTSLPDFSQQIKLQPNPAKEAFRLNFAFSPENFNLEIYNVQGQKVYADQLNTTSENINISIPADWSTGIYYVKMWNEEWNAVKKLMVDKN